jgi:hypothetical protein
VQVQVDQLAAELFDQNSGLFAQSLTGVGQLFDHILADWGRLQAVGQHVQAGDPGWTWDNATAPRIVQAMATGFEVGFYQRLLPLVYDIVYFPDVPFNESNDYGYLSGPCRHPYEDAPSNAYWTDGDGPYTIYLLATPGTQYPSSALTDQLFKAPDEEPAGLGIFKPRFFQSLGEWQGLRQVLPEEWDRRTAKCFLGD